MKLIVVNYSMSSKSLVFSHQRQLVVALSQFFDSIDVFTTEITDETLPQNVNVFLLPWRAKSPFRNAVKVLSVLYPVILKNRKSIFFTHMADIHAALISPLTWGLKVRHVLWYAHARNSIYLVWASFFLTRILSSTSGSCTLKVNRRKILYINQGICQEDFSYYPRTLEGRKRILYYGRLDRSKNIHLFPEIITALNSKKLLFTLDIFGSPANLDSERYMNNLMSSLNSTNAHAIYFKGPIQRHIIPAMAREYEIFLNLFSGSLDKTLIEATFMGLPVITWNREYCQQFGTWSGAPETESLDFILRELTYVKSLNSLELHVEIKRRLDLAVLCHSFDGWVKRLVSAVEGDPGK